MRNKDLKKELEMKKATHVKENYETATPKLKKLM